MRRFAFLFLLSTWLAAPAFAAHQALEVIQPRTGLTNPTYNRFYKAYPGIAYNIRLGVIGGDWPYRFSLTTNPVGMTIVQRTGEITWPNPLTAGSPHTVTVAVQDTAGATTNVTWTISVTTAGFFFVDAVNGLSVAGGGTGTLANPWKTFDDVYGGIEGQGSGSDKRDVDANPHGFVYLRTGNYAVRRYEQVCDHDAFFTRMSLRGNHKPLVWMAYPGESPVVGMDSSYIALYANSGDVYFSGIDFTPLSNCMRYGLRIDCDNDRVTVWKCKFHNGTNTYGDHNNEHALMISKNSPSAPTPGNYYVFQENQFYDLHDEYGMVLYATNKFLVEDNTFHDMDGPGSESHAIGPKESNTRGTIRGNTAITNMGIGTGETYVIWIFGSDNAGNLQAGKIETCYNNVKMNSANTANWGFSIHRNNNAMDTCWVYRNTFSAYIEQPFWATGASEGVVPYWDKNIVVNDKNVTNHWTYYDVRSDSATVNARTTNHLYPYPGENALDSNNHLQGSFLSYLGIRGFELAASASNQNPVIGFSEPNTTVNEGVSINFTASATDADAGQIITVTPSGANLVTAGLSLNVGTAVSPATSTGSVSGTLNFTASTNSPYTITWSVSDGAGGTASATTTLTVTDTAPPGATPCTPF